MQIAGPLLDIIYQAFLKQLPHVLRCCIDKLGKSKAYAFAHVGVAWLGQSKDGIMGADSGILTRRIYFMLNSNFLTHWILDCWGSSPLETTGIPMMSLISSAVLNGNNN